MYFLQTKSKLVGKHKYELWTTSFFLSRIEYPIPIVHVFLKNTQKSMVHKMYMNRRMNVFLSSSFMMVVLLYLLLLYFTR